MRDLTVLRQVAAHLDGWAGLRAWVYRAGQVAERVRVRPGQER